MATYQNLNDDLSFPFGPNYQSAMTWQFVYRDNVISITDSSVTLLNADQTLTILSGANLKLPDGGVNKNGLVVSMSRQTLSGYAIESITGMSLTLSNFLSFFSGRQEPFSQIFSGEDVFIGNIGDDFLGHLGNGADTMFGVGSDEYFVDNINDVIVAPTNDNLDQSVVSTIDYTLGNHLDNLTLNVGSTALVAIGNDLDNRIMGNELSNVLIGNGGNDTLDGRSGADSMTGGVGDDTYFVDNADDVVIEANSQGNDRINSTVSIAALAANVEQLELNGTGLTGVGNQLDNRMISTFTSAPFANTLAGLGGNDVYTVNSISDVVIENAGEGIDEIQSTVSIDSLAQNVENLTLIAGANGVGNNLNNTIVGNQAANSLFGLAGNDTLDGRGGADTMRGGTGDDIYVVNDAGDVVIELAGEGTDAVRASVSISALAGNVENLTLLDGAVNGVGNGLNNILVGNGAANNLTGQGGADTLDGQAGADTMQGGTGNDIYVVDNVGDSVVELANSGVDEIRTSVSLSALADNVENLTLLAGATSGFGNSLANVITGNAAGNVLSGLAGDDTLRGGGGDDQYIVTSIGADLIIDSSGKSDTLKVSSIDDLTSSQQRGSDLILTFTNAFRQTTTVTIKDHFGAGTVETLTDLSGRQVVLATGLIGGALGGIITGTRRSETLDGKGGDDILFGDKGADRLIGGDGDDLLIGGKGADTFVFDSHFGHDVIADFGRPDRIEFTGETFHSFQDVMSSAAQVGHDVVITLDADNSIVLQGVALHRLTSKNFSFF